MRHLHDQSGYGYVPDAARESIIMRDSVMVLAGIPVQQELVVWVPWAT